MSEFQKYIKKAKSKEYSEFTTNVANVSSMKQNFRQDTQASDVDLKEKRKRVKILTAELIDDIRQEDDVDVVNEIVTLFVDNINAMSLSEIEKILVEKIKGMNADTGEEDADEGFDDSEFE